MAEKYPLKIDKVEKLYAKFIQNGRDTEQFRCKLGDWLSDEDAVNILEAEGLMVEALFGEKPKFIHRGSPFFPTIFRTPIDEVHLNIIEYIGDLKVFEHLLQVPCVYTDSIEFVDKLIKMTDTTSDKWNDFCICLYEEAPVGQKIATLTFYGDKCQCKLLMSDKDAVTQAPEICKVIVAYEGGSMFVIGAENTKTSPKLLAVPGNSGSNTNKLIKTKLWGLCDSGEDIVEALKERII